jgi:hypothetical protein
MKVFNDKTSHLNGEAEDSLTGKARKEPNKEGLEIELL